MIRGSEGSESGEDISDDSSSSGSSKVAAKDTFLGGMIVDSDPNCPPMGRLFLRLSVDELVFDGVSSSLVCTVA